MMEVCKWKERPDDGRMDGWMGHSKYFYSRKKLGGQQCDQIGQFIGL